MLLKTTPKVDHLKKFSEVPKEGEVNQDYFYRMLTPEALKFSKPYNDEEAKVLKNFLKTNPSTKEMNLVAIGAGELWYLQYGLKYAKSYVEIEPLLDLFLNDDVEFLAKNFNRIHLFDKRFGEVGNGEMPPGPSLYVFLFNIFSYIDNAINIINEVIEEGDVLFISTWNSTPEAKKVRKEYFDYLNQSEGKTVIDPDTGVALTDFDHFPFDKLKFYKNHQVIKGAITNILVISTK
jgi:hypothetical protein